MNALIAWIANYGLFAVAGLGAAAWLTWPRRQQLMVAVSASVGGVIALALTKLAGALYYDPRPFVAQHMQPLIQHAPDNGFPSDHTVLAGLAAFIVLRYSRTMGLIMLAMTGLLGVARVAARVHHPLDIVGALVIAAVAALAGGWLADTFWSGRDGMV